MCTIKFQAILVSLNPLKMVYLKLKSSGDRASPCFKPFLIGNLLDAFLPTQTLLCVVWQKSNETDFLLTMKFILFTNQGYPLQNSSLGQLHSDGGVVSIVRSSAGRLLLEYFSARQLRSSGYYPKYQNGALSSGF